jgi:hypothetical protein
MYVDAAARRTRFGRSRCISGSACRRGWSITGKVDARCWRIIVAQLWMMEHFGKALEAFFVLIRRVWGCGPNRNADV